MTTRTPMQIGAADSAGWAPTWQRRNGDVWGPNGADTTSRRLHTGIEHRIMASLAEGLNILRNADAGNRRAGSDAETAPKQRPEFYQFDIDTTAVAEVWRRGSVIESWLLGLTAAALVHSPSLDGYTGRVSDSGEG